MVEAYCVKCREKKEMCDVERVVKKGSRGERLFAMGKCPVCGTKMSRVLPNEKRVVDGSEEVTDLESPRPKNLGDST